jgi:hypothetical protein
MCEYTIGVTNEVTNPITEKKTMSKVKLGAKLQHDAEMRLMSNPVNRRFL